MTADLTAQLAADLSARLREWIGSGSAQSPAGAFHAWLDADRDEPAFEYPEITGYALTHLAGVTAPTPQEIAAGRKAGDWLLERVGRGHFVARDGWDGDAVYNFDLAMMANGLLTFGALVDSADHVDAGLLLARRLAAQVMTTGRLDALPVGQRSERNAWSTRGSALMIKATQCLLSADGIDPDGSFREAADTVAAMARTLQQDDGRIVTHPDDAETMCHPHLYAVEGLWAHGTACDDRESLDRARAGAEWVWRHQLETGGLTRFVRTQDGTRGPEQFDVTAQAVRAAVLTGAGSGPAGKAAVARLHDVAIPASTGAALPYQLGGARHLNVWVSLFGAQALALHADGGRTGLAWRGLV